MVPNKLRKRRQLVPTQQTLPGNLTLFYRKMTPSDQAHALTQTHTHTHTHVFELVYPFLGAFTKLRKVTSSFVMSGRPPVWNNSASAGQILIKFDI